MFKGACLVAAAAMRRAFVFFTEFSRTPPAHSKILTSPRPLRITSGISSINMMTLDG